MNDSAPTPKPSPFRETDPAVEQFLADQMAAQKQELAIANAQWPLVRDAGVAALHRLMPIAQGDSGGSKRVATFLLGCYNGTRFPFDLTDFRQLDQGIFNDCIAVLRMDRRCEREVHCYFNDGSALFESLADRWVPKKSKLDDFDDDIPF